VLVVDDNEDFRTILATWIDEEFHRPVAVACDGRQATHAFTNLGSAQPGLVLLDLEMPVMDGRAFLAWLRENVTPMPRVVLVSASPNLLRVAKELGVEHAAKPVTVVRLRELLSGPA
jgi:two-component system, OmpR family, response regulator CpxR